MKFNIGDRVLVRADLEAGTKYRMADTTINTNATRTMCAYRGKVLTVHYYLSDCYCMKETGIFAWTDEMLAPNPIKFELNSRVKYIGAEQDLEGKIGTVIGYDWTGGPIVEFDDIFSRGHDGCCNAISEDEVRKGKNGHCWYCDSGDLELVCGNRERKIVISANDTESIATLYDCGKEVCFAKATMPEGSDLDFMGCAKRALEQLTKKFDKSKTIKPAVPLFNGSLVCIETQCGKDGWYGEFTVGKTYHAIDSVIVDDRGFKYDLTDWFNCNPMHGFCVYRSDNGFHVKFVILVDETKTE